MSVTLFRVNQRRQAIRALESAHVRNRRTDKPISPLMIGLVMALVLAFAYGMGIDLAIAAVFG